ncbi:MAG: hypothetical protein NWS20_01905 [Rickettsiaceae bacterium]|nr:hypothetical protein [Rickettsiaceae bacterium]MDP4832754.1 hypothetical protein [Rickettsiaceae bacterium]MDP5020958.1 hypothetical protein [Rickettsiaceae bacterium]
MHTAHAAAPIQIEVKVFGKDVIFVFYRDTSQIIDLNFSKQSVTADVNIPIEFKLLNPEKFNKYATSLRSAANKQRIVFQVKQELEYQSVIHGEKLEAIKFRAGQKQEEDDLSKIGSANNDPGTISYKQQADEHVLSFNVGNDNSKVAAFFRDKYIWIVFDQKKMFSFKEGGIFSKFEVVPSETGTVMRMRVSPEFTQAKSEKTNSGWDIKVSALEDKNWQAQKVVSPEPLVSEEGFLIRGNFANNEVISFEDPDLGDVISVVPVVTGGIRVATQMDSVEFSLLKSIQGIAVVLYSDDVMVEKGEEALKVVSDTTLPEEVLVESNVLLANIEEYIKLPTLLPYLDKNLDIFDFNERKSLLISEASAAKDKFVALERNLNLAKFFFIHGWYQESLDSLLVAKKYAYKEYQDSLQARFLEAVNNTMIGNLGAAKEEYDDLLEYNDIKRIAEINLWNNYNEFSIGAVPDTIGFVENLSKTISLYSDDKYWPIAFAEIELALLANDLKSVERIFREVRTPPEGYYANSLKFHRANYYKKKDQLNLAKQYYRDLTYQDLDMFNKVRAAFELVKVRFAEEEISISEAIDTLEGLRYSWRGDQLEYEILMQLANYYRENKDIMNALRTYQYIQSAFNNKVSNFYITSEMARIFNDVFLPGGFGEEMDDFTVVALFYEFKELNPIGEQGDDVIISIAQRLVRLDLLGNAADLLRHQINYRLKGEKRVVNADNLAIILMMDKKPSEAIFVLDDTDKDNFNFNEHQYRVRLRAKALIQMEKYKEALHYIKDDMSEDAEIIRREAIFQAKDWKTYANLVGSFLEDTISQVGSDPAAAQDILRLAISYYMLGIHDQLVIISNGIGDANPALKNTVDLLSTSSGAIDYKNLDKSLDIDQMKTLLDKYKNQFLGNKEK